LPISSLKPARPTDEQRKGDHVVRLDHLAILVRDRARSRDWYTRVLGLKIEFEVPDRKTTALQDDGGFTLFLVESADEWRQAVTGRPARRRGTAPRLVASPRRP
jgi:catechol 2,3-dioxygenase-like lactoylglutathione lyase family enzyme